MVWVPLGSVIEPLTTRTATIKLGCLIFGLTPFAWLSTWTLTEEYKFHSAEQNWEFAPMLQIMQGHHALAI